MFSQLVQLHSWEFHFLSSLPVSLRACLLIVSGEMQNIRIKVYRIHRPQLESYCCQKKLLIKQKDLQLLTVSSCDIMQNPFIKAEPIVFVMFVYT